MSVIATFIEGERAVRSGVFGERAQELDNVVSRCLPMFIRGLSGSWGTQQMQKMQCRMLSFPLTSI